MAPLVAMLAALSLVGWTGRWYLDDFSHFVDLVGEWTTFAFVWGAWPAVLLVFLYRTVTYTYRLTDEAVFVDYGPIFAPVPPVLLVSIDAVEVGGGWIAQVLKVGSVELQAGGRALRLNGVWRPEAFASKIRSARATARKHAPTK
ncbi:MAG: hypothetical protein U0792_14260 [Gemmataceae bacterium]